MVCSRINFTSHLYTHYNTVQQVRTGIQLTVTFTLTGGCPACNDCCGLFQKRLDTHSSVRIATGWTVRGLNPGGGEILRTRPDRPWHPLSLLYNGRRFSKKVKLSLYRPGQAFGVPGGWGSRIFKQSVHEGGKVVSHTHRPSLPPGRILGTHFC